MTMLDHALHYAGRGWRVFPCHTTASGACSCDRACGKDAGKHPRIKAWQKAATTDRATIARWWGKWSDANIGVATGAGLVVLDIDGERDVATLTRLCAAHGPLPRTLTSKTGRGFHCWFEGDIGSSKTAEELLVRGDGGYVLAPPSWHASGVNYQWVVDVTPAEFPEFFKQWLQTAGGTKENASPLGPRPAYLQSVQDLTSRASRGFKAPYNQLEEQRILAALAAIPANCARDPWLHIGMALHDLDWSSGSDGGDRGLEIWRAWSATCPEKFSDFDVETRWRSFGKPGRVGVTLGTLFYLAEQHGWHGNLPQEYVAKEVTPNPEVSPRFVTGHDNAQPHSALFSTQGGAVDLKINGTHAGPALLPTTFTAKHGSPLIELNEKYSVIGDVGGKCVVLSWTPSSADPTVSVPAFQTFKTFQERHSNRYVESKKKKKVIEEADPNAEDQEKEWVQLGTAWLKWPQRRTFERLDLQPNQPSLLPGNVLNLWRGFGVVPAPGQWPLMKAHIAEVLADRDVRGLNYIMRWAAWAVQNPGKPAGAALVFRGDEGTGKGVFARTLRQIFGQHGVQLYNARHMVGFNALLRNCLLLYADEAFWAGDKQGESTLKGLITEPTIVIEGKGVNAELWKNRLHVIMTSNADWVVPAGHSSRRYAVFDVAERYKQDKNYFVPLYDELDNGGREAMLHDLLQVEIGDWHPHQIVKNKALEEQKARSLDPLNDWYLHILSEGRLHGAVGDKLMVPSSVLYNNAQLYSRQLGNTLTATKLGLFLRSMGCIKRANVGKAGNNGWVFPSLIEARAKWEGRFGSWSWGDEVQDWAVRN